MSYFRSISISVLAIWVLFFRLDVHLSLRQKSEKQSDIKSWSQMGIQIMIWDQTAIHFIKLYQITILSINPYNGRRHKKSEKIWENSQLGLIVGKFLNFRYFWKLRTSPLGSNSDIFDFENILMAADPLGRAYQMAYLHQKRQKFIRKGQNESTSP